MDHLILKASDVAEWTDRLAADVRRTAGDLAKESNQAAMMAQYPRKWACDSAIIDAADAAAAAAAGAADAARLAADALAVAAAAIRASAARQAAAAAWDAFDAAVAAGGGQVTGRMPAGGAP